MFIRSVNIVEWQKLYLDGHGYDQMLLGTRRILISSVVEVESFTFAVRVEVINDYLNN